MPRRNLLLLMVAMVLSIVCYAQADRSRYSGVYADVLEEIESRYYEYKPGDKRKYFEAGLRGIVGELDENSVYLNPKQFRDMNRGFQQHFVGIGIQVVADPVTKQLTVQAPILGSPADRAGILAGDYIVKIEGKPTRTIATRADLEEEIQRIAGPEGEPVRLTIRHRGDTDPIDIEVVRASVETESVVGQRRLERGEWVYSIEGHDRIRYVNVQSFSERTAEELSSLLRQFEKEKQLDALILDLRDNHGGLLTAGVAVSDLFISDGTIVSVRGRSEKNVDYTAHADGTLGDFPLAVLINGDSASASEIVAACLKDHGRAIVVGSQSYGKATVQHVIALEGGRSALKLTTAVYFTPSGHMIHKSKQNADTLDAWGVRPTKGYELPLDEQQLQEWRLYRSWRTRYYGERRPYHADDEDAKYKDYVDMQLEKAVEFLAEQIK